MESSNNDSIELNDVLHSTNIHKNQNTSFHESFGRIIEEKKQRAIQQRTTLLSLNGPNMFLTNPTVFAEKQRDNRSCMLSQNSLGKSDSFETKIVETLKVTTKLQQTGINLANTSVCLPRRSNSKNNLFSLNKNATGVSTKEQAIRLVVPERMIHLTRSNDDQKPQGCKEQEDEQQGEHHDVQTSAPSLDASVHDRFEKNNKAIPGVVVCRSGSTSQLGLAKSRTFGTSRQMLTRTGSIENVLLHMKVGDDGLQVHHASFSSLPGMDAIIPSNSANQAEVVEQPKRRLRLQRQGSAGHGLSLLSTSCHTSTSLSGRQGRPGLSRPASTQDLRLSKSKSFRVSKRMLSRTGSIENLLLNTKMVDTTSSKHHISISSLPEMNETAPNTSTETAEVAGQQDHRLALSKSTSFRTRRSGLRRIGSIENVLLNRKGGDEGEHHVSISNLLGMNETEPKMTSAELAEAAEQQKYRLALTKSTSFRMRSRMGQSDYVLLEGRDDGEHHISSSSLPGIDETTSNNNHFEPATAPTGQQKYRLDLTKSTFVRLLLSRTGNNENMLLNMKGEDNVGEHHTSIRSLPEMNETTPNNTSAGSTGATEQQKRRHRSSVGNGLSLLSTSWHTLSSSTSSSSKPQHRQGLSRPASIQDLRSSKTKTIQHWTTSSKPREFV